MGTLTVGDFRNKYSHLGFSGGGLRCFWQGGALDVLRDRRRLEPDSVAATSGGALSAACFIACRGDDLLRVFSAHLKPQDHNFEIDGVDDDTEDLTPHQQLYRDVVEETLTDSACDQIASGPGFEVLLARPPRFLPLGPGAALTMVLYKLDKLIRSSPHGRFAKLAGARELRIDARQAAREGLLRDLVCLAASIPPVFEIRRWKGKSVIDAGTIENAPLPETINGAALVLLTRSYRNLPKVDGRTYIYPSEATPADKIDFTDADALERTYRQGQRDMEEILSQAGSGSAARHED